ncbi:MAG TPA: hypothetical protein VGA50_09960 [Kiloniellales bacterium]
MPVAVTVASLALDTGSYMMSGKTLTDHGLSMAMEEDCSMVRVFDENDEICQEKQDYEVADTALTPLPADGDLDIGLASGGDPWNSVGYAQLAERVNRARTVHANYLAAGMMESEI